MPEPECGTNKIIPFSFQVPPNGKGASANVSTGPPEARTVFNFPSAKNPTEWPSGDQNGRSASSVPVTGCAEGESSGLSHNILLPCASTATSSNVLPSGDTFGQSIICAPGGGSTEEMSRGGRRFASRK